MTYNVHLNPKLSEALERMNRKEKEIEGRTGVGRCRKAPQTKRLRS